MDVATKIKIIFTDITLLGTAKGIVSGFLVIPSVVLTVIIDFGSVDIIELGTGCITAIEHGGKVIINLIEHSVLCLCIGKFVLRSMVQIIGSRQYVIEITALMVVESKIHPRVSVCTVC